MTTKKQLEERIEELENKLGEEQRKWYLFPLFLLSLIITISWVYLSVKYFGLFEVFLILPEETTFMNLRVIPNLLFNYFLISITSISLVVCIKNWFIKDIEEELIWGLTAGLIAGLVAGLIAGLMVGLIWGLIWGLATGLIIGLIKEFVY